MSCSLAQSEFMCAGPALLILQSQRDRACQRASQQPAGQPATLRQVTSERRPTWKAALFCLLSVLFLTSEVAAHPSGFTQVDISFPAHNLASIEVGVDLRAIPRSGPLREFLQGPDPHEDPAAAARIVRAVGAYLLATNALRLDDQPAQLEQVAGRLLPASSRMAPVSGAPGHDGRQPGDPGRVLYFRFQTELPGEAKWLSWKAPEGLGKAAVTLRGSSPYTTWLRAGQQSAPLPLRTPPPPPSMLRVLGVFIGQGFGHILPAGLDHVLFVLGLFLLSARIAPLLWQVSAFTLAHCITLALATFGVFSLPAAWVEPLIALSIVYVGLEDLFTDKLSPWRAAIVFGFGLLHGLGFASALSGLHSLKGSSLLTALLGFNVGVELGQITVLVLAFALVGWFRIRSWYRQRVVRPIALIIAATGALWTIQRIMML